MITRAIVVIAVEIFFPNWVEFSGVVIIKDYLNICRTVVAV